MPAGKSHSFEQLEGLTREREAAAQALLSETIDDLFSTGGGLLTERERTLMLGMLRDLLRGIELPIRHLLVQSLQPSDAVPRALAAELADAAVELACPVLLQRDLLRDPELIEMLRYRMLEHELSLAIWRQTRDRHSVAAGEGGGDLIAALLEGRDPALAGLARTYLVAESERLDPYQNPRLRSSDLSGALAMRLCWRTAAVLRAHLLARCTVEPSVVDDVLEAAVRQQSSPADERSTEAAAAPMRLAERLMAARRAVSRVLAGALACGALSLFEALLARLAGLERRQARRLIFAPGGELLAVLCRAVEIETASFAAILRLLAGRGAEFDRRMPPLEVDATLALFGELEVTLAKGLLRQWCRAPEFREAIRQVGGSAAGAAEAVEPPPGSTPAED